MSATIYRILNLTNGKCYVGSTTELARRWALHRCQLRKGKHHSRRLQGAFNKYGADQFSFEVLEGCPDEHRALREKYWIDKLNTYRKGYNCIENPETRAFSKAFLQRRGAAIKAGLAKSGGLEERNRKIAEANRRPEARKLHSESSKRRWADPISRKRMSDGIRKAWETRSREVSEESRKKMGVASARRFRTPEGRKKASENSKKGWLTPLTPEQRRVRSENMKRIFSDPEVRKERGRLTSLGIMRAKKYRGI